METKELKEKKLIVNKKGLYEHMGLFITLDITLVTVMAGTIWFTFNKMTTFSAILIFIFIISCLLSVGFGVYALIKEDDKIARLAIICFFALLVLWGFYVMAFLVSSFNIKFFTMDTISTNITNS